MPDSPEALAVRLKSEGEKTLAFFNAITPDQWDLQVYTDGQGWKIQQILAHMVDTEEQFRRLIENIAGGGEGAPEGYQIDAHNARAVIRLQDQTPAGLLSSFESLRQVTAALVAKLPAEALDRTGRHPFLGVAPLVDIIKLVYRHGQIHQRDIRRSLPDNP